MKLNKKELKMITAGASGGWITAGIVAGISFIIGIIDGFVRPFKWK